MRSDLFDINPHRKGRVVDEQGEITGVTVVDMRGVGAEGWFAVLCKNQLVFGGRPCRWCFWRPIYAQSRFLRCWDLLHRPIFGCTFVINPRGFR